MTMEYACWICAEALRRDAVNDTLACTGCGEVFPDICSVCGGPFRATSSATGGFDTPDRTADDAHSVCAPCVEAERT